METVVKRLTRSRRDRVFGGVCGGFADYVGWDAVIVRVAYVVLTVLSFGFGGVLLYALAWMIIPVEDTSHLETMTAPAVGGPGNSKVVLGTLLLLAGALALMGSFLPWFWHMSQFRILGPLALIAVGIVFLLSRRDHSEPSMPTSLPPRGMGETTGAEGRPTASRGVRRLLRVKRGRKIAGVCAGVGEYFDIDPTIVRLLAILLLFMGGSGIILYLVMWVAMPLED